MSTFSDRIKQTAASRTRGLRALGLFGVAEFIVLSLVQAYVLLPILAWFMLNGTSLTTAEALGGGCALGALGMGLMTRLEQPIKPLDMPLRDYLKSRAEVLAAGYIAAMALTVVLVIAFGWIPVGWGLLRLFVFKG